MKAIICERYGPPDVLRIAEVKKPIPGEDEVLVRIRAAEVTSGDARIRGANVPAVFKLPFYLMMGIQGPRDRIPGGSFSGEVESVGRNVTRFSPGDRVMVSTFDEGLGAYAQYRSVSQDRVMAPMPENLSFEEAACLFFGGHTALHFLRKGGIKAGQDVLIFGASGAVGSYAVQLARHFGAHVTGVAGPSNQELVASLGARTVIDYTREDFTKMGTSYDIIFDTVGKSPFNGSVRSLNEKGFYLRTVHLDPSVILKGMWTNLTTSRKVIGGVAAEKVEDMVFLAGLAKDGELKPVIDHIYPLEQVVDAHLHVDGGHKRGSVVLSIP